jgi:hypothetical protein
MFDIKPRYHKQNEFRNIIMIMLAVVNQTVDLMLAW